VRGAEALVAMRRRGYAPRLAIVDLDEDRLQSWRDWEVLNPAIAKLAPGDGEHAARADLRCVVGLNVLVTGDDAERVRSYRDACIAANAKRVVAFTTRCTNPHLPREFWRFEALRMEDATEVAHG